MFAGAAVTRKIGAFRPHFPAVCALHPSNRPAMRLKWLGRTAVGADKVPKPLKDNAFV
jgi:hypothetical protein